MPLRAVVTRLQTVRVDVDRLAAAWDKAVKIVGSDRLLLVLRLLKAVGSSSWRLSQMVFRRNRKQRGLTTDVGMDWLGSAAHVLVVHEGVVQRDGRVRVG